MSATKFLSCIAIAVVCGGPLSAAAAVSLNLDFKGTVSPGSFGAVFLYDDGSNVGTSFDGQPVDFSMSITSSSYGPYVSDFSLTWSNQTYAYPFITGWSGTGFPNDPSTDFGPGNVSTVSMASTGGAIQIDSNMDYDDFYDAYIQFSLSYSLSAPQGPNSSFTDNGVTGGGYLRASVSDVGDPRIVGYYDADSYVPFTLSSVTQVANGVPEPATWALLATGVGATGAMVRRRRRRLQLSAA